MGGMTAERMEKRVEPLRWPCPALEHPGVSTLYLDHPSWYQAVEAIDSKNRGKRFLTPPYNEPANSLVDDRYYDNLSGQ